MKDNKGNKIKIGTHVSGVGVFRNGHGKIVSIVNDDQIRVDWCKGFEYNVNTIFHKRNVVKSINKCSPLYKALIKDNK